MNRCSPRSPRFAFSFAFAFLLVFFAAPVGDAHAQTRALDVEDGGGDSLLHVNDDGGFAAYGDGGTIPAEGAGRRMMWYPGKAAFRAGRVSTLNEADAWDDANVGFGSAAFNLNTEASGGNATAFGERTTASGGSSVAMGLATTASGDLSVAMGYFAKAQHDDTFVWADDEGAIPGFASTGPDQFLICAGGGVGIGTNSPQTQLDVSREVSGSAGTVNHVAFIENTATSGGDVLALKSNASSVTSGENFLTFKSAGNDIGAIQGNGSGGVELISSGGDFAELLPRRRASEQIEAGDVVGILGGQVTKATAGAAQVSVVTDRAAVLGNDPGEDARSRYEKVSFVGQVPVRAKGPVAKGDLLVASRAGNGTARAVAPSDYAPGADGPVVGQAWEASSGGTRRVNAVIGPAAETAALRAVAERQREEMDELEARLAKLEQEQSARVAALPGGPWALGGLLGLALVVGVLAWRRRR